MAANKSIYRYIADCPKYNCGKTRTDGCALDYYKYTADAKRMAGHNSLHFFGEFPNTNLLQVMRSVLGPTT